MKRIFTVRSGWEDGRRLNTCRPSWERVRYLFRSREGSCRFCKKKLPPDQESDDEGEECDELSTFQLVKKYVRLDGDT